MSIQISTITNSPIDGPSIDPARFQALAKSKLGLPYVFGAKWDINDTNPTGPTDCSGAIRWIFNQFGLLLPEGSQAQYEYTLLLNPQSLAKVGSLGFFLQSGSVHHVGALFDETNVWEARGSPFNSVILRPRENWERFSEFSGWHGLPGT